MKELPILVAEDDPMIARLVEFKLHKEGFHVIIARNGQEAIDLLPTQQWSLIILDVMMPVLDGWGVLSVLRTTSASQVPVLMLTAKNYQEADITRAAELGATQFLRKPFDPADLLIQVKKIISLER